MRNTVRAFIWMIVAVAMAGIIYAVLPPAKPEPVCVKWEVPAE